MGKFNVKFKHNGINNLIILSMVLAFFVILAPLAYTSLPSENTGPKNDVITGLALSNTMEPNMTTGLLVILSIVFLLPVELMLRKHLPNKEVRVKKAKRR